jgi:hypothetical protein
VVIKQTIIIEGAPMRIPIEQLLNLPKIQVMNVEITEREIKCDIESTRGYSICRRLGQNALGRYVRGEVDRNQFMRLRQIGSNEISLLKGCGDFVTSGASAASGRVYAAMKLLQINGARY